MLFNAKAVPPEGRYLYNLTYSWENKGVHIFPKRICQMVNVIAQIEFELPYYKSAVHRVKHYTLSLSLSLSLYIYIYIYIVCVCERETLNFIDYY